MTMALDAIRNDKGDLPAYAWPGGYPVAYLTGENDTLCPKCANVVYEAPEAWFIHYEGPDLQCDECYEAIESAYGDPDSED